jgi:Undecaprenyl-phosphate glucose phosphotransferase
VLRTSEEGGEVSRARTNDTGGIRWTPRSIEFVAIVGDLLIVGVMAALAHLLRFGHLDIPASYLFPIALAAILCANVFRWRRLYELESYGKRAQHLLRLTASLAIVVLVLMGIGFGSKTSADFSRLWFAYWMMLTALGLSVWFVLRSILVQRAQAKGLLRDRLLIVGDAERVNSFGDWFQRRSPRGLSVLGVVTPDGAPALPIQGCRVHQGLDGVARVAEELMPDRVVLMFNWREPQAIDACIRSLRGLALDVELVLPRLGEEWVGRPINPLGELLAMNLMRSPLSEEALFVKRLEDYLFASLLLLATAPVLLLIAVLIKLDSPGPVFYRQRRVGFQKREFAIYKFRTMRSEPAAGFRQATRDDDRVTRLGRFLRASSLDELPQLINVLRGEMSLVGPRPHEVSMNAEYADQIDDYLVRHKIKPGITGWAQVNGARGETRTLKDMELRLSYDLAYVDNWSLWLDLQILLRTAGVFLFQKNAY